MDRQKETANCTERPETYIQNRQTDRQKENGIDIQDLIFFWECIRRPLRPSLSLAQGRGYFFSRFGTWAWHGMTSCPLLPTSLHQPLPLLPIHATQHQEETLVLHTEGNTLQVLVRALFISSEDYCSLRHSGLQNEWYFPAIVCHALSPCHWLNRERDRDRRKSEQRTVFEF